MRKSREAEKASCIFSGSRASMGMKCSGERMATPAYFSKGARLGIKDASPTRIRPSGMKSFGNSGVDFSRVSGQNGQKILLDRSTMSATFGFSALKGRSKTRPVSPVRGSKRISKGISSRVWFLEWIDQTDLRTDFLELDAHRLCLLVIPKRLE